MLLLSILLAAATQSEVVATGQAAPKVDTNLRQAALPGREDVRILPVDGLECKYFLGYSEMQTFLNLLQGESACSGEVPTKANETFRQVNFLKMSGGKLPLVIHSPLSTISKNAKFVIFLSGGPRTLTVSRPLVKLLTTHGFVVIVPVYLGSLETKHPAADLPVAVDQIKALYRWAGSRLRATIGVSAGGYLAAASCLKSCSTRFLLAPPLTTPKDSLSSNKVNWNENRAVTCLWQFNGSKKICESDETFFKSFWGKYYDTSLSTLLNGNCKKTRIFVSPADKRVYDQKGLDNLRSIGCHVDTPMSIEHAQIDANETLNKQLVEAIEILD